MLLLPDRVNQWQWSEVAFKQMEREVEPHTDIYVVHIGCEREV